MNRETTPLEGALLLTPRRFGDARGWFAEVWNDRTLEALGIDVAFVQDNHSFSGPKGTLRGLHYQAPPHAQTKLVRCSRGAVWDVAVDVRAGSPTFGHWHGAELSAENGVQYLIPQGFLHGFVTLTDDAEVQYKCSDYYAPEADGAVMWNSPSLSIKWPLDGAPILSGKDEVAPDFAAWETPFVTHEQAGP
ncbi:MAG: dTDP-4-dehydrorhamnose 3,5-epimerase [Pseudomonadota bacterium]